MAAKAPKPTKSRTTGKLAGKTVAFVGKFGYGDTVVKKLSAVVAATGGKVVAESARPDYLVAGEGRGGNPPAAVAKVQKQNPAVQVLDLAGFCQMMLPSPDELLAEIRAGLRGDD